MTFYKLEASSDPAKKWQVRVPSSGGGKTVHFGAVGYSDYTIHKDKDRRERYRSRHRNDNIDDPLSPGFWSWWALWGDSSDLSKAFADAVRRAKKAGFDVPRKNPMKQPEDLEGFRFAVMEHQKARFDKGRIILAAYDDRREKVLAWMAALPLNYGRQWLEPLELPKHPVAAQPQEWAWEVSKIHSWEDGWGPLMYEAMLVVLAQKGYSGWLLNDPHCTSMQAREVWRKFANRSDVEFVEYPSTGGHPRFAMRALPALLKKRHKLIKKPDTDRERKKLVKSFLKDPFKEYEESSYAKYREARENPLAMPSLSELAPVLDALDVPKKLRSQFLTGFQVEWEHADTVGGDPLIVGRIVMDHLEEDPKYYSRRRNPAGAKYHRAWPAAPGRKRYVTSLKGLLSRTVEPRVGMKVRVIVDDQDGHMEVLDIRKDGSLHVEHDETGEEYLISQEQLINAAIDSIDPNFRVGELVRRLARAQRAARLPRSRRDALAAIEEASGIGDHDLARADKKYYAWKAGRGQKPKAWVGGELDAFRQGRERFTSLAEAWEKSLRGARTWMDAMPVIEALKTVPGFEDAILPDDAYAALNSIDIIENDIADLEERAGKKFDIQEYATLLSESDIDDEEELDTSFDVDSFEDEDEYFDEFSYV